MSNAALIFMVFAWAGVLGLVSWTWYRLLRTDPDQEHPPPPGTSL